ncbi:hypothetical protein N7513_013208 [Penicillium frequentans]|nr:hypothetical protein N7513_013208 [Penicillium glabrum]
MATRGLSYLGLDAFYEAASNGFLTMIPFIVGPTERSENPPYMPSEGAWLQKQIVEAVVNGPNYDTTALFISYDETGGFGDHVTPFHFGNGTTGEWIENPYDLFGYTYTGSGRVFTERYCHNSQILFLEAWLEVLGYGNVTADDIEAWRREHIILDIPSVDKLVTDSSRTYTGTATCESTYRVQRPAVPYGNQTEASALHFEDGFKLLVT